MMGPQKECMATRETNIKVPVEQPRRTINGKKKHLWQPLKSYLSSAGSRSSSRHRVNHSTKVHLAGRPLFVVDRNRGPQLGLDDLFLFYFVEKFGR